MAESIAHMNYVRRIVEYIASWSGCMASLIEAELPDFAGRTTQAMNRYYPDVYYRDNDIIAIGEAKTDHDIDNSHTEIQLDAYIEHTRIFSLERHIILSCSFVSFPELKNMAIRKKRRLGLGDITFHILAPYHSPATI